MRKDEEELPTNASQSKERRRRFLVGCVWEVGVGDIDSASPVTGAAGMVKSEADIMVGSGSWGIVSENDHLF